MKKLTVLLIIGVAAAWGCGNPASNTNNQSGAAKPDSLFKSIDTTKLASGAVYYQCLMHPEVMTDKPGNCPKCGDMALEKRVKQ